MRDLEDQQARFRVTWTGMVSQVNLKEQEASEAQLALLLNPKQ